MDGVHGSGETADVVRGEPESRRRGRTTRRRDAVRGRARGGGAGRVPWPPRPRRSAPPTGASRCLVKRRSARRARPGQDATPVPLRDSGPARGPRPAQGPPPSRRPRPARRPNRAREPGPVRGPGLARGRPAGSRSGGPGAGPRKRCCCRRSPRTRRKRFSIVCRICSANGEPAGVMVAIRSESDGPDGAVVARCICRSCARKSSGSGSSSTSSVSVWSSAAARAIPAGPVRGRPRGVGGEVGRAARGARLHLQRRHERQQEERRPAAVLLAGHRALLRTAVPCGPQQRLGTLPVPRARRARRGSARRARRRARHAPCCADRDRGPAAVPVARVRRRTRRTRPTARRRPARQEAAAAWPALRRRPPRRAVPRPRLSPRRSRAARLSGTSTALWPLVRATATMPIRGTRWDTIPRIPAQRSGPDGETPSSARISRRACRSRPHSASMRRWAADGESPSRGAPSSRRRTAP